MHLTLLHTTQNQGPLWKLNALWLPAISESRPALSKNFSWETKKQAGHQPNYLTNEDEVYAHAQNGRGPRGHRSQSTEHPHGWGGRSVTGLERFLDCVWVPPAPMAALHLPRSGRLCF